MFNYFRLRGGKMFAIWVRLDSVKIDEKIELHWIGNIFFKILCRRGCNFTSKIWETIQRRFKTFFCGQ